MNEYDLIPDIKKLEVLFVMESPHTREVISKVPCSGSTGIRMSNVILSNQETPFGYCLKEPDNNSVKYGIMNSFNFPLGIENTYIGSKKELVKLKALKWKNEESTREEFYNEHFEIIKRVSESVEILDFKKRLFGYIKEAPNLRNIVFCGFIVQSVFMYSCDYRALLYNEAEKLNPDRPSWTDSSSLQFGFYVAENR